MKIAWFSPLPPVRSDVANFTRRLEPDLSQRFDARFLTEDPHGFSEPNSGRQYPTGLGHVSADLLQVLNRVDVPVYNLGNHPEFFARTWFLSQTKPGVVVLHDLKLHHLFDGIHRCLGDKKNYLELLEQHYGAPGLEAGRLYVREKLSIDFMAQQFPMLAWGLQNALAVLVHTAHARETVERQTGLPTCLNALPYDANAAAVETRAKPSDFPPARPARLVIFGHLNRNRRVVEFLQALSAMEERPCFEVHVYGELQGSYAQDVRNVIQRKALQAQVTLHGFVAEETLDAGLARGDLAINLRYPTMGEASGSLLRIWDHALPALVTLVDGYAALPADTVGFVRPDHESADIQHHLRSFLAQPEAFRSMGERGRAHLLQDHRPDTYAARLAALCKNVADLRSRQIRLRMGGRVGTALATWQSPAGKPNRDADYARCIVGIF